MATLRRSRTGGRASTKRRTTQWLDTRLNFGIAGASTVVVNLTSNLTDQRKKGTTVISTIVDFRLSPDTTGVTVPLDYGIVLGDMTAITAGLLADPSVDDDQPTWMYRTQSWLRVGDLNDTSQFEHVRLRLKSMRKWKGNEEDVVLVLVNPTLFSVTCIGIIRLLVKLPA